MDTRNETNSQQCRFLDETYFLKLYNVFIAAFSDYVMPFELTEQQFRNHIVLNAVDLSLSVGVIDEEKLIGFTLNGFGMWLGVNTVYDAGTGVLPEFRRRGLSKTMFDIMTPVFKDRGVEQWLLEVITTNEKAIGLYKKLGFYTSRTLSLLQPESELSFHADSPVDIVLRDIHEPDWSLLRTFWNGEPSWQNSIDALSRSRMNKRFIGAFHGDDCLGYIVFSTNFARLAQIVTLLSFGCAGRLERVGVDKVAKAIARQVQCVDDIHHVG